MSFKDDTVWRAHLDIYNTPAEALPIINITSKNVWTEEWSGSALHNDGTVEKIGKRKRIALNRYELTRNGFITRGRVLYSFDNPDERMALATAEQGGD
jgi:hypothetical protein